MTAKDAIRLNLDAADMVVNAYISDLTDADLFVRPVPGMNHLAWQLGHLIAGEAHFINLIRPGSGIPLPDGFQAAHTKETIGSDDPAKFFTAAQYRDLWAAQRKATKDLLEGTPHDDLDRTDPSFPSFAPSVAAIFSLCAWHPLMHTGQFVPVRRLANKPVVI